jgi:mannose-6-phosphate isomerase-like protein (cupin superfamily)
MRRGAGLFALTVFFAIAQSPKDAWVLTDQEVNATFSSIRAADPKNPIVSKLVGRFGGPSLSLIQRNADGVPEVHLHKQDVIFVRQGSATLVSGGEVVNGKEGPSGEIRGESIRNGTKRTLHPGDIIQVPAAVPHQMLVSPGETVAYAAIKIDAP